jgi:hypothetical protein
LQQASDDQEEKVDRLGKMVGFENLSELTGIPDCDIHSECIGSEEE